jgi:hypothetical protein
VGLVPEDVLERRVCVFPPEEDVDRLLVSDLDECEGTHVRERNPVRAPWLLSKQAVCPSGSVSDSAGSRGGR